MRVSNILVLASTNRHKHEEFLALLEKFPPLTAETADKFLRNADKIGSVETFSTYAENSAAKARLVNQGCHYPTLADDTGLEVLALDGAPGVKSHRFATAKAGVPQDVANVQLLLEKLKGAADRRARFVCSLSLVIEGVLIQAEGTIDGTIIETPRGNQGFGYDNIFVPNGSAKTFAELSASEKNAVSHRAKALDALMEKVKTHGIVFARV